MGNKSRTDTKARDPYLVCVAREERVRRSHQVVVPVLAPEDVADVPPAVEHAVGEDLGGEFLIDRRDLIRSIAKGKHGCHQASGGRACSEWISLFFFLQIPNSAMFRALVSESRISTS